MSDTQIFDAIDKLAVSYGPAIAAFARHPEQFRDKTSVAAEAFGSGFFLAYKGHTFLVTAHHVVEDAHNHEIEAVLSIHDGAFTLKGQKFAIDNEADIAATLIDPVLKKHGISVAKIPLAKCNEPYVPTEAALFLGFPNSKNVIARGHKEKQFRPYGMSVVERKHPFNTISPPVRNPICFHFPRQKIIAGTNVNPQSRMAPYPHGMSGGPALRIYCDQRNCTNLKAELIGVGVRWLENEAGFVAAHHCDIWPLLDYILERN